MKFFNYSFLSIFLLVVFIILSFYFTYSLELTSEEGGSPFECGFDPITPPILPFSMPFFIISLMFMLFDVEILLLFFYPLFYSFSFYKFSLIWSVLVLILLATLYEWFKGILSWL